ncbi:Asparagine--tRNA ligase, cytoplasmic 1 -like protein [Gossypium arboreum]|uniref:Asparagine--tRNA ligase, cytoplasmic 1-like protein n=3 Tax=Gossypium TaxID=3633 RepID=A0A0B0N7H6_GOSAR|nr:Asparagine--tRNA ligase, cytoplasmic 1 -like protein [Gossypium arboreum]
MNLTGSVENHAFSDRVLIRSIVGLPDGGLASRGNVSAPVVIMDAGVAVLSKLVATGTCVVVDGILKVPPEGTKQRIELRVEKNKSTLNSSIRNHIRTFGAYSICFTHTQVPVTDNMYGICYCNDMLPYKLRFGHHLAFAYFKVSNHLQDGEAEILEKDLIKNPPPLEAVMEAAKQLVSERGLAVKQLKDAKASKADTGASVVEINKVETYAYAVSNVYTFGPTFPAEQSHTSRHLAEFWMVEPEIAFADLQDDMNCAEAYVKYTCKWLLEKCLDDMEFMAKSYDKGCINRLKMVASTNANLSILLYLTSWMIFK